MTGGILQKRLGHGAKIGHSSLQDISRPFYWAAFIEFRLLGCGY
jgi:CHAT domain-containing protein